MLNVSNLFPYEMIQAFFDSICAKIFIDFSLGNLLCSYVALRNIKKTNKLAKRILQRFYKKRFSLKAIDKRHHYDKPLRQNLKT